MTGIYPIIVGLFCLLLSANADSSSTSNHLRNQPHHHLQQYYTAHYEALATRHKSRTKSKHSRHPHLHLKFVHGVVNIIGWGILVPAGTISARVGAWDLFEECCNSQTAPYDHPWNSWHHTTLILHITRMAASAMDGVAAAALRSVLQRVQLAAERCGRRSDRVRIVAVSKTKPVPIIRQVYDAGHRCFGENYVQELVEKAPQLPDDIEWHFIGNLQRNKVKPLLTAVPNLSMVESVDDEKIANQLDRVVGNIGRKPLKVLVQVNTSGEETKSGVEPAGCLNLVKHVTSSCPNLEFHGLMTIGMPDYTSTPENFKTLAKCRSEVCKALGISEEQCELSMGMSGDFELAFPCGTAGLNVTPFIDCMEHDPELRDGSERNVTTVLVEELELRETEVHEIQQKADQALLEAKKLTSQYQKEADKCSSGMETCEEAREKAEAALEAQRRVTAMWELRARQKGWKDNLIAASIESVQTALGGGDTTLSVNDF
nr:proline synthase co-transcribed bacterial homolog protein-like [Ipomoea batatas]